MSKEIKLTKGKVAIVDDEDYEWLNQWKWYARESSGNWYASRREAGGRCEKRALIHMHRLILGAESGQYPDHINHNGLDNRRENLRISTHSLNLANQRLQKGRSSRYKGVCFHKKRQNWIAGIKINQKRINLGYFPTETYAAKAYDNAAIKYFGEFAFTNKQAFGAY
jgi:hypothetical protein